MTNNENLVFLKNNYLTHITDAELDTLNGICVLMHSFLNSLVTNDDILMFRLFGDFLGTKTFCLAEFKDHIITCFGTYESDFLNFNNIEELHSSYIEILDALTALEDLTLVEVFSSVSAEDMAVKVYEIL